MNVYFANGTNIVVGCDNEKDSYYNSDCSGEYFVVIFARKMVMSAARKILAKDFLIQMAM